MVSSSRKIIGMFRYIIIIIYEVLTTLRGVTLVEKADSIR